MASVGLIFSRIVNVICQFEYYKRVTQTRHVKYSIPRAFVIIIA